MYFHKLSSVVPLGEVLKVVAVIGIKLGDMRSVVDNHGPGYPEAPTSTLNHEDPGLLWKL